LAAEAAGLGDGPVEIAELQAAFTHEELLLARVLGLGGDVAVNPSGGALRANPIMATGLCRIGYAANHIRDGGHRALAHSTSGPCLQQNLVCILEDTP
jgi:acetyl-CoA acetyltransferase